METLFGYMLKYRSREIIAEIILRPIKENNGISRTKTIDDSPFVSRAFALLFKFSINV